MELLFFALLAGAPLLLASSTPQDDPLDDLVTDEDDGLAEIEDDVSDDESNDDDNESDVEENEEQEDTLYNTYIYLGDDDNTYSTSRPSRGIPDDGDDPSPYIDIYAEAGDDVIESYDYSFESTYVYGGEGNDTLTGAGSFLYGGEGDDVLSAAETMEYGDEKGGSFENFGSAYGGEGNDHLSIDRTGHNFNADGPARSLDNHFGGTGSDIFELAAAHSTANDYENLSSYETETRLTMETRDWDFKSGEDLLIVNFETDQALETELSIFLESSDTSSTLIFEYRNADGLLTGRQEIGFPDPNVTTDDIVINFEDGNDGVAIQSV